MKIAIQGELGSFSHEAVSTFLPDNLVVPCISSFDVFNSVKSGRAGAALIPVENSLAGPVGQNLDLLVANDGWVQKEFRLRIRHNLIGASGVSMGSIRRVLSHPVALEQCREFFRRHRAVRPESFYDTAGSVKHVNENKLRDTAAIAGLQAAKQYGGRVLLRSLEDDKQNFTRFFL